MALPSGPGPGWEQAGDGHASDHLVWTHTVVDGHATVYGVAGEGLPVVFLHGWGLGQHSYKRALSRLVHLGCRVYAPALPGFGGTGELGSRSFSFAGYAAWVDAFMTSVGIDEPVFLIGHSFGGGVAIRLAHDFGARVRTLVLVNSVGGSTWTSAGSKVRSMADRPLWDWGLHFPSDVLPLPQLTRIIPVMLEDALPNALRNPRAMWRVAQLARKADLTEELEELKVRGTPVLVLWGDKDQIIPRASFDALCQAIGSPGEVVRGTHSWLLADPEAFGEVMTNIVSVARVARDAEREEAHREQPKQVASRPRRLRSFRRAKPSDVESEAIDG